MGEKEDWRGRRAKKRTSGMAIWVDSVATRKAPWPVIPTPPPKVTPCMIETTGLWVVARMWFCKERRVGQAREGKEGKRRTVLYSLPKKSLALCQSASSSRFFVKAVQGRKNASSRRRKKRSTSLPLAVPFRERDNNAPTTSPPAQKCFPFPLIRMTFANSLASNFWEGITATSPRGQRALPAR